MHVGVAAVRWLPTHFQSGTNIHLGLPLLGCPHGSRLAGGPRPQRGQPNLDQSQSFLGFGTGLVEPSPCVNLGPVCVPRQHLLFFHLHTYTEPIWEQKEKEKADTATKL